MRTTLKPTFFKDFQCIGGKCEDTCCAGWDIYVDKDQYQAYKKNEHVSLKPLFEKNLLLNSHRTNDNNYGILRFTTNQCAFLNEDKLCKIQLNLGESALCQSCKSYPRITNLIGQEVERTLALSCPEAVRMLFSLKEGIDFEIVEDKEHYNLKKYIEVDIADIVFTIRAICIQMMQNRSISLEKRLLQIGQFIQGFTECPIEKQLYYLQVEFKNINLEALDIKSNEDEKLYKISMTEKIIQYMLNEVETNNRYLDVAKKYLAVFGETLNQDQIADFYCEAEKNYNNYCDLYGYQLENVLVNVMFQEIFPFDLKDIMESYYLMIFRFAIIKSKILSISVKEEVNPQKVEKIVQTYFKTYEHQGELLEKLFNYYYDGEKSLAQIFKNLLS